MRTINSCKKCNVFKIRSFLFIILFLSTYTDCKKKELEGSQGKIIHEKNLTIQGTNINVPNATIYINGTAHQSKAQFPFGKICTIIYGDSVYFVYNDGVDTTFSLSRTNSIIALNKLIFHCYETVQEGKRSQLNSNTHC